MKSLSEKFDVLKEEVGNLTLARKLHLTATWIPQVMNRVVIHLQTLLGLRAGRLGETGKSKRGIDALGAELSMTKGADALMVGTLHVFGHGQTGWMKIPTRPLTIVKDPHFANSDEKEMQDAEHLEVSEKTKFFGGKCTQSVPNSVLRKAQGRCPLPMVAATRTPQLDVYIRSEVKSADKDLAKIQTFVLDALALLVSILDLNSRDHCPAYQDTIDAISTAVELIGNASARISHLRQEKVTLGLNKTLLPLCQDDENFKSAAPSLFGP